MQWWVYVVFNIIINLMLVQELTNGDASSNGLSDVEQRSEGVEEFQHHHCTAKLLVRYDTFDGSGLREGLQANGGERMMGGRANTFNMR